MRLWKTWFKCVEQLRPACSRQRTFFWMVIVLMGFSTRCGDLAGVTSIIRVMGLDGYYYDRLLDFFHSPALSIELLVSSWTKLVFKIFASRLLTVNGRHVLVVDGIKIGKEGKKMPAVKSLHQESESNTKPEYIMGHSCQAIAILASAMQGFFAVPLISQIHEGLSFSNRDKRTLFDKLFSALSLLKIKKPFYLVADAYYGVAKMINGLVADGNHLITRVKKNATAYVPATPKKKGRGRPKKYGKKVRLKNLFKKAQDFVTAKSPIYNEKNITLKYYEVNLLCRIPGILVKYVAVIHPTRGKIILMSTDLGLSAIDIIKLYGLRAKIETSFKQSLHTLGAYSYHFWLKVMDSIKRKSGKQHLHHKPEEYRKGVKRKMSAYHRHIQLGLIAQGLLQYLSCTMPAVVWKQFGSWLRTIRTDVPPSEQVTAMALRNSLPSFLANNSFTGSLKKFIKFLTEKIDISREEGARLIA